MSDISREGTQILCSVALPVGSHVALTLDEHAMPPIYARVVNQRPINGTTQVALGLVLTESEWPFDVFSKLAFSASEPPPAGDTALAEIPACFRDLGLSFPCTSEDVRQAFRNLAKEVHPDKGGDIKQFVALRTSYFAALRLLGEER